MFACRKCFRRSTRVTPWRPGRSVLQAGWRCLWASAWWPGSFTLWVSFYGKVKWFRDSIVIPREVLSCSHVQLIHLAIRRNLVWTQIAFDLKVTVGSCRYTGAQNQVVVLRTLKTKRQISVAGSRRSQPSAHRNQKPKHTLGWFFQVQLKVLQSSYFLHPYTSGPPNRL